MEEITERSTHKKHGFEPVPFVFNVVGGTLIGAVGGAGGAMIGGRLFPHLKTTGTAGGLNAFTLGVMGAAMGAVSGFQSYKQEKRNMEFAARLEQERAATSQSEPER